MTTPEDVAAGRKGREWAQRQEDIQEQRHNENRDRMSEISTSFALLAQEVRQMSVSFARMESRMEDHVQTANNLLRLSDRVKLIEEGRATEESDRKKEKLETMKFRFGISGGLLLSVIGYVFSQHWKG